MRSWLPLCSLTVLVLMTPAAPLYAQTSEPLPAQAVTDVPPAEPPLAVTSDGSLVPVQDTRSNTSPAPSPSHDDMPPQSAAHAEHDNQQPEVTTRTELDRILRDAANDLRLQVQHTHCTTAATGLDYTEWETTLGVPEPGYVNIGAMLVRADGQWSARVALALPDGTLRSVRTILTESNYEIQLIKGLRQVARDVSRPIQEGGPHALPQSEPREVRSDGRAILATQGALLGGYVGFTLENAGGAAEARLVYPLVALGAGVGLASSLIVAEEWDVTRAEAWYVSATSAWLTGGAILIASEFDLRHATDRYSYGLIGTTAGLGIAGLVTGQRDVSDAESLLAHSGGLLGVVMGGLTQRLAQPTADDAPRLGMGIGATVGVLVAGVGGSNLLPNLSSSRVLFADLGGLLGGLAGAAVGSPALVGKDSPDANEERLFVAAALGGLVLGTVVGYWIAPDAPPEPDGIPSIRPQISLSQVPASSAKHSIAPRLPSATMLGLNTRW